MNKTILLEEWLEIKTDISPRAFDQVTTLYRKFMSNEIWEIVFTFEAIKMLLVSTSKASYIDKMLDWEDWVTDLMSVLDDWSEKVLDIMLKMKDRKKKSIK